MNTTTMASSDPPLSSSSTSTSSASSSDQHRPDNEALEGALKTEDDFLAYLASVRHVGKKVKMSPPSAPKPKPPPQHHHHHHHQQQHQLLRHHQVSPPILTSSSSGPQVVPQVGLDHLDNLCRLMEQLGSLREQNSRLQKRVHYLEDLHAARTELVLHRPQSQDSMIESCGATAEGRERSKSEDMGTVLCSRKSALKSDRTVRCITDDNQQPAAPAWDSSVEDIDPLNTSDSGRQGRSLDRGIRLQNDSESKKRNSAWGRVKTIIQTRKDSLKRKQRRPDSSGPDAGDAETTVPQDEVKKSKQPTGTQQVECADQQQDGTSATSKWNKVKRAFLTKRSQPMPLQRSQSVPSNPFDEDDLELGADDVIDDTDFERPISQDVQRHIAEIQRNLSQDFNRKLTEWERMRRTGSSKQSSQKRSKKDLQWLDKELSKLARDKERLARERQKFDEREARLQRLRRSLRVPRDDDDQVLIRTPQGEFRFPGISGTFTRRLLEWEEKRGLGPDLSTLALLDQSTSNTIQPKPAKLERNRSRSDSSIVENSAQREDAFRATSEPELTRAAAPDVTGSYGNLLDHNLILLEQLRAKEETCCHLQGQLEQLDVRIKEMLGNHSKELDKYRQQLESQQQGAADPRLLADIQCHLKDLHSAEKRLETNRRELEASYSKHSEQQTVLAQELVDKMAELHSRSAKPNDATTEQAVALKIQEVDVSRIQVLSTELLQQAQQLEEALADRNTMLRHLRWELLERETSSILQQSQQPKTRKPRKHWTSLEGITKPYILKQKDDSQRTATPDVDVLSEALQARVRALQEGLVKLWTSTEKSPRASHKESQLSRERSQDNETIIDNDTNNPSRTESYSVRARRLSDTSIHYDTNSLINGSTEEPPVTLRERNASHIVGRVPWRKPERQVVYATECVNTDANNDLELPVTGGKLDFAAAFSMAICDEDALQPLHLPDPPVSAAATVSRAEELERSTSTLSSPVEQDSISNQNDTYAPMIRLSKCVEGGVQSLCEVEVVNDKIEVPLASSDTDTDESIGASFSFHKPDSERNYDEQFGKLQPKQPRPSTPIRQRDSSMLPIKVRPSPLSPPVARRTSHDSGAPCVRTMVARFNQRLTPSESDGVCKSSSFASTEAPKNHDVAKSASASDCRSAGPCRLPTRVPQSPRNGNGTPRPHRAAAPVEASSSVPVSPRLRSVIRGTNEGTSSVPASPSRIPRPSVDNSPQSPMARTRALKLRHAREEFLARDLVPSPSPEVTRRVATVSPVVQRRYETSREATPQEAAEANDSSPQQQSLSQRAAAKSAQHSSTCSTREVNNDNSSRETAEAADPSPGHKSGFFSFRFRKTKLKKKDVANSTIGMLCRQSLLVDIPDRTTEGTPGDTSPQSCPSSPEAPRCARAKPSWLTKPKLFKQK